MLQAPKQPKFFQKYSSFRKYLQYRKRLRKMPVKKFVSTNFHKIQGFADVANNLKIADLPTNTWTSLYFQNARNSRQKMFYKIAFMHLWLKFLNFTKIQLFTDIFRNFWPRVQSNYDKEQHFAGHFLAREPFDGCFWNVFFFLVLNIFQSPTVSLLLHLRSVRKYMTNKLSFYWLFSLVGHREFRGSWLTYSWGLVSTIISIWICRIANIFL